MNQAKIFTAFTFLLVFAVCVSAQNYSYSNELKEFELFANGKWKTLIPYVSTKEDVIKIFGSDCKAKCDYDKDWKVRIDYVSQSWWMKNDKQIKCKSEDLLGKVETVYFFPRKQIFMKEDLFSSNFKTLTLFIDHAPLKTVFYDTEGLIYALYANEFDYIFASEGQKFDKSNNLYYIAYRASKTEAEKLSDKLKCFDFDRDAF